MFMIPTVRTYPSAQALGFFDVELRVQLLEAKDTPLSRLEAVINLIHRSRKSGGK